MAKRLDGKLERRVPPEIWDIERLPDDERLAMLDAIEAYKHTTNTEFKAGACAVAFNGEKSVKHNHTNEPGKGQEGHAEMLALSALYDRVNPAARRLKIMALAASYPDEELFRGGDKFENGTRINIKNVNKLDVHRICGRCRKMISDYTGNSLPDVGEKGKKIKPWDPVILLLMGNGQVLRTSLSVIEPLPHIPHQTLIRPWEKNDPQKAPDTYSAK